MPTRLSTNFPRLTNPDEFESLIRDICSYEWGDSSTQKFGRKGQKQYGVDVYGHPTEDPEMYYGAQCKLRTQNDQLSENEIEKEVSEAKSFPNKLAKLIIVTDAPRDTNTQIIVSEINKREVANGGFQVVVWFWDDITERISAYPRLIVKYYQDFYANLTSLPIVERLVDEPMQIFVETVVTSEYAQNLEDLLRFRGIRIFTDQNTSRQGQKLLFGNDYLDGLIIILDFQQGSSISTDHKTVGFLQGATRQLSESCPVFIVVAPHMLISLEEFLDEIDFDLRRVKLFTSNRPLVEATEIIFRSVFSYGFARRGGIRTIDICVRSLERQPSSALLDMDWHSRLTTKVFPNTDEWEGLFIPAIATVKSQLLLLGDAVRIQINSQLPIPAAVALGFHFNVRETRLGVWARTTGASDFKEQFWLSDSSPANIDFDPQWYKNTPVTSRSAALEITTYVPIHRAVEAFVNQFNLQIDKWLSMSLEIDKESPKNINESQALAFASQIGQQIRLLNSEGIIDIHLFCRIPSAIGVLIGQRLHACGRIHLYWFENPGYRYAFSLS